MAQELGYSKVFDKASLFARCRSSLSLAALDVFGPGSTDSLVFGLEMVRTTDTDRKDVPESLSVSTSFSFAPLVQLGSEVSWISRAVLVACQQTPVGSHIKCEPVSRRSPQNTRATLTRSITGRS